MASGLWVIFGTVSDPPDYGWPSRLWVVPWTVGGPGSASEDGRRVWPVVYSW